MYWLIYPYPTGLLHWHCGNLTITPVPAKQPWWIWVNASCEFIMNDYITTTKQSTTKPCANFLGYTVHHHFDLYCYAWLYLFIASMLLANWYGWIIRLHLSHNAPGPYSTIYRFIPDMVNCGISVQWTVGFVRWACHVCLITVSATIIAWMNYVTS